MIFLIITLLFFCIFQVSNYLLSQTNDQLRDPEFLVDQYNQLVQKHNALIEKTRNLIDEQNTIPSPSFVEDSELREQLNEALAKVDVLEDKIDSLKQQELKSESGKTYLEDSNSSCETAIRNQSR